MTNTSFGSNDFEILKQEILYQNFFRLVRYTVRHKLFNGGWSSSFSRELFERHSAAAVLPYDPILDRVILIEQFRPGSMFKGDSPWIIEIPAGIITNNSMPLDIAYHEAQEEAGCEVNDLELICEYFVSPGGSNEYLSLFYGRTDATHVGGVHGLPDENEDIRVLNLTTDEAFQKLAAGDIKTSPAIISLQWLKLHRERLRAS